MKLLKRSFKQKNGWSCGPAAARIILHHFGIDKNLEELSRTLKTTREGTSNTNMARLFKKAGLRFEIKSGGGINDLKKYLGKHLILTSYWIPRQKESHYSIIKKINSRRVYLHDSWFGANHNYTLRYFLKNWRDDEARSSWFLAIKNNSLSSSKRNALAA